MSVSIRVDDDGKVEVEHDCGTSIVHVAYDEDATTIGIGKLQLVVSRTQASLFEGEGDGRHRILHREL